MEVNLEKKLTANQLFKEYKDEGGTLNFSDWLTREKTKGIFPINANLNQEVGRKLIDLKQESDHNQVIKKKTKLDHCKWVNCCNIKLND